MRVLEWVCVSEGGCVRVCANVSGCGCVQVCVKKEVKKWETIVEGGRKRKKCRETKSMKRFKQLDGWKQKFLKKSFFAAKATQSETDSGLFSNA